MGELDSDREAADRGVGLVMAQDTPLLTVLTPPNYSVAAVTAFLPLSALAVSCGRFYLVHCIHREGLKKQDIVSIN